MTQQLSETQLPKIAIIGPAPPYRSGIAIHTQHLREALAPLADVDVFSFKRQYPQWLYPGKDTPPDLSKQAEPGIHYSIDVYNPVTWRKTADAIVSSGCQVAVLTWWTLFWQPGFTYMLRRLKKKGIKTVLLCHNLANHKTGGAMGAVDSVFYNASITMLKQADAYIVQSTDQEERLLKIKPGAKFMRRMHPVTAKPTIVANPLPKRGRLELLFFGLIRPYKGLDTLLAAAKRLNDTDLYLSVVGEPWGDQSALLAAAQKANIPNLETKLAYVSDADAAAYFERADAVVLPYRKATGSAVAALAYAYDKPIVATAVSGLVDAVVDGKTGWLVEPQSPEALASAITKLSRDEAAATKPNIIAFKQENSWPAMGQAIVDFVKTL